MKNIKISNIKNTTYTTSLTVRKPARGTYSDITGSNNTVDSKGNHSASIDFNPETINKAIIEVQL